MAAEMAVGMAMAQQKMNQTGGLMAQSTPGVAAAAVAPAVPATPAAATALLTPAQVAELLGVAESDVLTSLEAGDLKGKRIGSQWRITRAAVDSFLAS
jgi:excisionase family DNA binding protein